MRALLKWLSIAWVSVGTLMMLVAVVGAIRNPANHFGLGLMQLTGRTSLLVSAPLALLGIGGAWLAARNTRSGAWLIALFSTIWTICLGLDQFNDFEPAVATVAGLYLLTAVWGIGSGVARKQSRAAGAPERRKAVVP